MIDAETFPLIGRLLGKEAWWIADWQNHFRPRDERTVAGYVAKELAPMNRWRLATMVLEGLAEIKPDLCVEVCDMGSASPPESRYSTACELEGVGHPSAATWCDAILELGLAVQARLESASTAPGKQP